MGKKLHFLGEYIFNHPKRIVAAWLVILVVAVGAGVLNYQKLSNAITIPGTQAQQALDKMQETFPDLGAGSGRIAFKSLDGPIASHKSEIDNLLNEVSEVDGVQRVINPFQVEGLISQTDNSIAYAAVQMKDGAGSISEESLNKIADLTNSVANERLEVARGGDLISQAPGEILGVGEVVGVGIALLVLIITFASIVAAGMPIVVAIIAVGVSMGGLFGLSKVLDLNATTPVMAIMLGLAVGIDYSLFIISKYLFYRREGYAPDVAAGKASGTAGNAVIFAAMTVVIALSALSVAGIPFMTIMGLAGAATVAMAAIVAVTLIPALLGIAGNKVLSVKIRRALKKSDGKIHHQNISKKTPAYKWANTIVKYPILFIVLVVGLAGVLTYPVLDLKLGLPSDKFAAEDSTQRKAYDILTEGFGEGDNYTIAVFTEGIQPVDDAAKNAISEQVRAKIDQEVAVQKQQAEAEIQSRIASASSIEEVMMIQQAALAKQSTAESQIQEQYTVQTEKAIAEYGKFYYANQVAEKLKSGIENSDIDVSIKSANPVAATEDGVKAVIQVTPEIKDGDGDKKARELIAWLRSDEAKKAIDSSSVEMSVTGSTAMQDDIEVKLAEALPLYLAVVIGLSLLILVVAFRSILVPIKATLGFLISVGVMFGAMVAVFQWGWFGIAESTGPLMSFIPIIAIGILFGLAMDYEFFLVSSMHEAYEHSDKSKKSAKESIVKGFASSARVVTAAAVIMIAVFAGFIFNHDQTIKAIGLGLAVGVFVDAFIVRMTLVPAILSILGRSAWWMPRWMDKVVPKISIEGESDDDLKSNK